MIKIGKVSNLFDLSVLEQTKSMFVQKLQKTDGSPNDCYGLEQTHLLWPWFEKKIFSTIRKHFDHDITPIFVMYMDAIKPFEIHGDEYWHKEKQLPGKPYVSFIIPVSVDNDPLLTSKASTVVFNERFLDTKKLDNAMQYYNSFLSHCDPKKLAKATLKEKFDWSVGDLIFWDSTLQHASGNFNDFSSKQCFVGHTFVV